MKCIIFRCSKKTEMYLYLPWQDDEEALLKELPNGLLNLTGSLSRVMELELAPDVKLARVNVTDVITSLTEKGFYIQMPPNEILRNDNSMLSNPSDSF